MTASKPFMVYHDCKGGCGLPPLAGKHLKGSYYNPVAAWLKLRALRREFYASQYFMLAFGHRV